MKVINLNILRLSPTLSTVAVLGFIVSIGWGGTAVVLHDNYSEAGGSYSIPSFIEGDFTYIHAERFAEAMHVETYREPVKRKLVYYFQPKQLKLTAGNHFALLDDKVFQLPAPVKELGGSLYIPLEPFIEQFEHLFPGILVYYGGELSYNRRDYNILGMASSYDRGMVYIDILTSEPVEFSDNSPGEREFVLHIPSGKAEGRKFGASNTPQGLESIDYNNGADGCTISFTLTPNSKVDTVYANDKPLGVRVVVSGFRSADRLNHSLQNFREGWRFDTIVIDPGHGGKDPGAVGKSGLKEKVVTLDIALRLEKLLKRKLGVKTVLTRRKDVFIPLHERGKIANRSEGKLFVSIHANASRDRRAHGVETYFLSPARTDKALRVAELENASIKYEADQSYYRDMDDENFILLTMTKSNDLKESETLAGYIQSGFADHSGLKSRGVDQAGFYVLYGANMPAILFEVAFISNRREEKLLKSKKFRQETAEILCNSIIKFCQAKEKEL